MALPTLTRTIDDDFTNTWYEIRATVIDNVLESNILTLALREHGALTTQVGGEYITRTVGYGQPSTQRFDKGSVLTQEVVKLDTMARWDWRYFLVDVNRTLIDDNKNAGTFKIKDYLTRRLMAAKDALSTDLETDLFRWGGYHPGIQQINGLYDINTPLTAEAAVDSGDGVGSASNTQLSGTANGNIDKSNTYWRNWCSEASGTETRSAFEGATTNAPYSLNLVPDMRHFFNLITNSMESPNFIIMDQNILEAYEDEVSDKQQIVRSAFNKTAADLGFETLTFKGATMTYSNKLAGSKHIHMLNLNHIELVYNPNMWFDMTNWKETANQLERVAYITCMTPGLITDQPRRHGIMEYSS